MPWIPVLVAVLPMLVTRFISDRHKPRVVCYVCFTHAPDADRAALAIAGWKSHGPAVFCPACNQNEE